MELVQPGNDQCQCWRARGLVGQQLGQESLLQGTNGRGILLGGRYKELLFCGLGNAWIFVQCGLV